MTPSPSPGTGPSPSPQTAPVRDPRDRCAGPPAPGAVALAGVSKAFGPVRAVDGVDLEVRPGEFFSMLGPSGSGKTTVLRMIAGFEQPSRGRVLLGGVDVTRLPPFTATSTRCSRITPSFRICRCAQNIEYGLKVRRVPRAERAERADEALRRCGCPPSATGDPRNCPAGSASASRWPGPWSTGRRCCCWTSRSAPWT